MPELFRHWLRRNAQARGITQTNLALELEVNQSAVQKWWAGTSKPNVHNANQIADFFGVPRSEVYELIGPSDRRSRATQRAAFHDRISRGTSAPAGSSADS